MAQYPTSAATDSDLYVAVNQLSTILNGSLDASQTTVTVTSTTGFPTVGFITIDSEVIKYTSTNSTQFLSCTRGADGTGATTHSSGATVKHAVTAAHHNALKDEVKAVESDLVSGMSRIINMNSHKITNLTDGTASSDAAAFGQVPTVSNGTFTPTVSGFGTISNGSGFYQRVGNMVHVWGTFKTGTVTGTSGSIAVPTGSIVYTNRAVTTGGALCGTFFNGHASANPWSTGNTFIAFLDGSDTSNVYVAQMPALGTAGFTKLTGVQTSDSNAYQWFDFWYAVA